MPRGFNQINRADLAKALGEDVGVQAVFKKNLTSYGVRGAADARSVAGLTILPIFDTNLGTNFLIQERMTVPFTGIVSVRLWFANSSNAASNVNDLAVAGSTVFDPGAADAGGNTPALWQPVADANGNGGSWQVQSGAPAFTVPAASGKAFAADATNDGNINMAPSNWFTLYLPQATDAPAGWSNLFVRSHAARAMNNYANRGYLFNLAASGNYFRRGAEYGASSDFVAANQANFSPIGASGGRNASIMSVARIEIISTTSVINIWNTGDSIPQGLSSTGQSNNYLMQFCASATVPGKVIYVPSNYCFEGKPNHTSLSFARQELAKTVVTGSSNRALMAKPQFIFVDPYSNNDPFFLTNGVSGTGPLTSAQAYASYGEALQFSDYAESLGVAVIFRTKPPYGTTLQPYQEAVRVSINNAIRSSNRRYLDVDAAVTDNGVIGGNGIARIQPAFTPDQVHLNDAGHAAVRARFATDLGSLSVLPSL